MIGYDSLMKTVVPVFLAGLMALGCAKKSVQTKAPSPSSPPATRDTRSS